MLSLTNFKSKIYETLDTKEIPLPVQKYIDDTPIFNNSDIQYFCSTLCDKLIRHQLKDKIKNIIQNVIYPFYYNVINDPDFLWIFYIRNITYYINHKILSIEEIFNIFVLDVTYLIIQIASCKRILISILYSKYPEKILDMIDIYEKNFDLDVYGKILLLDSNLKSNYDYLAYLCMIIKNLRKIDFIYSNINLRCKRKNLEFQSTLFAYYFLTGNGNISYIKQHIKNYNGNALLFILTGLIDGNRISDFEEYKDDFLRLDNNNKMCCLKRAMLFNRISIFQFILDKITNHHLILNIEIIAFSFLSGNIEINNQILKKCEELVIDWISVFRNCFCRSDKYDLTGLLPTQKNIVLTHPELTEKLLQKTDILSEADRNKLYLSALNNITRDYRCISLIPIFSKRMQNFRFSINNLDLRDRRCILKMIESFPFCEIPDTYLTSEEVVTVIQKGVDSNRFKNKRLYSKTVSEIYLDLKKRKLAILQVMEPRGLRDPADLVMKFMT